jgi:hypothetical protein
MRHLDDEADDDTVPCPYCRQSIYEDALRCPHCENYISAEDAPPGRPNWFVVAAVVCLVLVAMWVFNR